MREGWNEKSGRKRGRYRASGLSGYEGKASDRQRKGGVEGGEIGLPFWFVRKTYLRQMIEFLRNKGELVMGVLIISYEIINISNLIRVFWQSGRSLALIHIFVTKKKLFISMRGHTSGSIRTHVKRLLVACFYTH